MKSINLYRPDGDYEVWERAEQDAKAADLSLSGYVAAVLRERQKRDDEACGRLPIGQVAE